MKRRRRKYSSGGGQSQSLLARERFNTPFAELGALLERAQTENQSEKEGDEPPAETAGDLNEVAQQTDEDRSVAEEDLFLEAMAGVKPLECNRVQPREPGPLSKPSRRPLLEGEVEAYAELVDLVSGEGSFDIQFTDEYIEGALVGADSELLPKLRRGDFSIQAHFDLHGMTTSEAREAVERFILASAIKGLRCVLIIHGRGLNSRDHIPILKQRLSSWLKRGRLKQLVLAFSTAQPCDGGAGALYVLLRKCPPENELLRK
jgi:DNA-nicking Smr family endonuclease